MHTRLSGCGDGPDPRRTPVPGTGQVDPPGQWIMSWVLCRPRDTFENFTVLFTRSKPLDRGIVGVDESVLTHYFDLFPRGPRIPFLLFPLFYLPTINSLDSHRIDTYANTWVEGNTTPTLVSQTQSPTPGFYTCQKKWHSVFDTRHDTHISRVGTVTWNHSYGCSIVQSETCTDRDPKLTTELL